MQTAPTKKRILDHGARELRVLARELVTEDDFTAERFARMILDAVAKQAPGVEED